MKAIIKMLTVAICCYSFLSMSFLSNQTLHAAAPTKQESLEKSEIIEPNHYGLNNLQWNELTAQMALTSENGNNTVQIFDVKEGHVVKSVPNSSKIQKQVKRILKNVYEFAPEVQPDMKAKYIIRIPVKSGTTVKLDDSSIAIGELFIFYYVDKEPLLLVFDESKKPFLFHTSYSIKPLLKVFQVE